MINTIKKQIYTLIACLLLLVPDAKPLSPSIKSLVVGGLVGLVSSFGCYKLMGEEHKDTAMIFGGCLGVAAGIYTYKKYAKQAPPVHVPLVVAAYTPTQIKRPTPGLVNLGNTCFMNAALQTELNSRHVRHMLSQQCMPTCRNNNVVGSLQNVFHNMVTTNATSVSPNQFNILARATYFPMSDNYVQHDSQEFLQHLLDDLDDPINTCVAYPCKHDGTCIRRNALRELYRFNQNQMVTCGTCEQTSISPVSMRMLSLPIAGCYTLQESLDGYFASVVDAMPYSCTHCSRDGRLETYTPNPTKQLTPIKLPKRLLLHLKRFNHAGRNGAGIKNSQALSIPLSLNDIGGKMCNYELQGFHVHIGSVEGGHYVAYLKDPATTQWYLYDDNYRTPITQTQIQKILTTGKEAGGGTPYVVCYDQAE